MTIMPCVLVLVGLSLIKFGALALTPKALDITPASYPNADTDFYPNTNTNADTTSSCHCYSNSNPHTRP